jgi:hypothetical protein
LTAFGGIGPYKGVASPGIVENKHAKKRESNIKRYKEFFFVKYLSSFIHPPKKNFSDCGYAISIP